ncbi:MAG: flagellar brake domain-containing protein [Firmicutes bacterium]|nr:flagellar brake domain-containing protein [Bacillota bacterium]MDH7495379.1 flagellar brake domain-containing protein [Bacillota bacterium]
MEVEDVLKVNQRVTLVVPDGRNAGSYPSRVEDIGLDAIVVAAPTHKGVVLKLEEGEAVRIQAVREDGVYKADTVVEAVITYPFPMIQLAKPSEVVREQRRKYARADVSLPARYRCLGPMDNGRLAPHKGTVTNVSGGGALIVTWQSRPDLRIGSEVDVELELPCGKIAVRGVVVRMSTGQTEAGMVQEMAVEFREIDERQRDALARYVLQRQLELRRKGLL